MSRAGVMIKIATTIVAIITCSRAACIGIFNALLITNNTNTFVEVDSSPVLCRCCTFFWLWFAFYTFDCWKMVDNRFNVNNSFKRAVFHNLSLRLKFLKSVFNNFSYSYFFRPFSLIDDFHLYSKMFRNVNFKFHTLTVSMSNTGPIMVTMPKIAGLQYWVQLLFKFTPVNVRQV